MRKFKLFLNFDEEEKWLNRMAKEGYELENVLFTYKFRRTEPQDAVIKIDCRQFRSKRDFIDYCALFEDSGWKHMAGNQYSSVQYFKRTERSSNEDIFSDKSSKAARYKRLSAMWIQLALIYAVFVLGLSGSGGMRLMAIFNPKLLYLTPGLWERQGVEFWRAFWFETPFAVYRGTLVYFLIILLSLYFIFAYKANKLYREESESSDKNS